MYRVTSTIDDTGKEVLLNDKDQQTLQKFLWTAAQLGDLSIVIGNGTTMAAAAVSESESAKSWMSVVEDLCKSENIHEIFLESRQKDLLQIAELVSNIKSEKHKEFDIYQEMRSLSMLEPCSFHFALRKLCEISKVRHIITTNYDNLIEDAFFDIRDSVRVLVRDPSVPNYLEIKNKICISKMHGSCQPVRNEHQIDHFISRMDFHDSIVMSESDYDTVQDHLRRQDTKESILLQAASKPVLIIGKGLYSSDTTFLYLLRKTKIARLNNMARVINAFMLPNEDRTEFELKFNNFSGFYLMFEKPSKDDIIKLLNLRLLPLVIHTPSLEYVKNYHRATCLGFDWLFQNQILNQNYFVKETEIYMKKRMTLTSSAPHCLCIGICAWNRYFELLHVHSMDLNKRNIPTLELESIASGPALTVSATCRLLLDQFHVFGSGMISMVGKDEEAIKIIRHCSELKLNYDGIVQLDSKNTWKSNVYLTRNGSSSSNIFMDSHIPFSEKDWQVLMDKLNPKSLPKNVNSLLDNLLHKNTNLKVIYLDKYLFKSETCGITSLQDNYLFVELLKFSCKNEAGEVDILLETGAYKKEEQRLFFVELGKVANILTVSFGFFTRYLLPLFDSDTALNKLQQLQQQQQQKLINEEEELPPIPFKIIQTALDEFVTLFENKEKFIDLLQGIASKADCFVNPNAKRKRWIIITLQMHGCLGIDLLHRRAIFVKNHQPIESNSLYSASAGDVFRGALAAELILSHYYNMEEEKLLEHCLVLGNFVASYRCQMEKMTQFYDVCKTTLSQQFEEQPSLFKKLGHCVVRFDF